MVNNYITYFQLIPEVSGLAFRLYFILTLVSQILKDIFVYETRGDRSQDRETLRIDRNCSRLFPDDIRHYRDIPL